MLPREEKALGVGLGLQITDGSLSGEGRGNHSGWLLSLVRGPGRSHKGPFFWFVSFRLEIRGDFQGHRGCPRAAGVPTVGSGLSVTGRMWRRDRGGDFRGAWKATR